MNRQGATRRLMTEYKALTQNGSPDGMFTAGPVTESDFFVWEALIAGPKDTPFEGGIFTAKLTFPSDYPLSPFKMTFDPPIFHPNVVSVVPLDADTHLKFTLTEKCDDPNMYEQASERWSPVQSVEKVILSVVSMLAEPNLESPANVDAAKMYRTDRPAYEKIVRKNVEELLGL